MPSVEAPYGGSEGGRWRLRIDSGVEAQEAGNNRSLVITTVYMRRVAASNAFNLDPSPGTVNVEGNVFGVSTRYDGRSSAGPFFLVNRHAQWIGHNNDGTRNIYVGASHDARNSPFLTGASTEMRYDLPTIARYANYTQHDIFDVRDRSFRNAISTDVVCDQLAYSLNDAPWVLAYAGGFTVHHFTVDGLQPNTDYRIRYSIRRADSGLWHETGHLYTRTINTSKFFDIAGF